MYRLGSKLADGSSGRVFRHDDRELARMSHFDVLNHMAVLCCLGNLFEEVGLHIGIKPAVLIRVFWNKPEQIMSDNLSQMVRVDRRDITHHARARQQKPFWLDFARFRLRNKWFGKPFSNARKVFEYLSRREEWQTLTFWHRVTC